MTPEKYKGEDSLSVFEKNLWSLHQYILMHWGTYTIFKWHRANIPHKVGQLIEWFVPADATHRYEIVKFLETELAGEIQPEIKVSGTTWPASDVKIMIQTIRCVEPYMTKESSKKIAEEQLKLFMQMFYEKKDKKE